MSKSKVVQIINEENAAQKISRILKVTPDIGVMVKKIIDIHGVIDSDEPLDRKLRCIVNGLPPIFRFPKNLRIMIQMDVFKFSSMDFKEEKCRLSIPILVHGKPRGHLTLCYSEPIDHSDEISFNEFERMIPGTIVEALGLATERKEDEEALMGSEELYHLLFNASRDAVIMLAFDSTPKPVSIIEANDRALELLGYSREELKTLALADLCNMASVDHSRNAMKKTLSDREGRFETIMIAKDGRGIPLEINAHIFEYKGEPVTLCVLRDLSEQRRTETALHDSEAMFKTICDNMMDLISEVDMKGMFVFVSTSHKFVVGYESEELVGKSLFDFLHPVDADRIKAIVIDSVGMPEFGKLEVRFRHAHGYYVWLETIGKLRLDVKGYPVSAILTSRDITKRKKIEAELKVERDFSSAIIDVAPTMVIALDIKGEIVRFNRACEKILGYSSEETIGRSVFDIFLGPLRNVNIEKGRRMLGDFLAGNYPLSHESKWIRKDGSPLSISWAATALVDDHQRVQHIIITGVDITAQRLAEEDLKERMKLESLLGRVSEAAVVVESLPDFLNGILKDICETYDASRSTIFRFNVQSRTMSQILEWCAPGVAADSNQWQDIPVSSVPADYETMMREEIVVVDDSRNHYDPLFRDKHCKEGIGAVLSVPVTLGNEPYGTIGLDQIGSTRKWKKEEVDILLAIARIVGHVIERDMKEEMLEIKDTAIEMAVNTILLADPDGRITYVNKAFLRGTGYKSKEEVIGKPLVEFFQNPADAARATKNLRKNGFVVTRAPIKRADGSVIDVEITVTRVADEKGNIRVILGTAIDVRRLKGYAIKK